MHAAAEEEEFGYLDRRCFLEPGIDGAELMRVLDCGDLFLKPLITGKEEESSGSNGSPSTSRAAAAVDDDPHISLDIDPHFVPRARMDLALEGAQIHLPKQENQDTIALDDMPPLLIDDSKLEGDTGGDCNVNGNGLLEDLAGVVAVPEQHGNLEGDIPSKDEMLDGLFRERYDLMLDEEENGDSQFVRGMDLADPFQIFQCHPMHQLQRSLSIGHIPMHHLDSIPPPHSHPLIDGLHGIGASSMLPSALRRFFSAGDVLQSGVNSLASQQQQHQQQQQQDEGLNKVGRYTAEERKVRIDRYRQKRTERNFIKKIKYACRKTLADSRPRIRGRFAKNQDAGIPQTKRKLEDDDDEDGDVLLEDDDEFTFEKEIGSDMKKCESDSNMFEVALNSIFEQDLG